MTQRFHEGDEVEVEGAYGDVAGHWRKAKIVRTARITSEKIEYEVQFTDGSSAVFAAEHIRAIEHEPKIIGYAKTGFVP